MLNESLSPSPTEVSPSVFHARHPMFEYQIDAVPDDFRRQIKEASEIVVVGMGGSVLPLKVFIDAFNLGEKILLIDSVDPQAWEARVRKLHKPLFCFVSKSGTTLELLALSGYFLKEFPSAQFGVVSDSESSLSKWARDHRFPLCSIPSEIGGRFTNFTAFHGLLLEKFEISFNELLEEAKLSRDFLKKNSESLEALYQQIFNSGQSSLILWAYGERVYGLALWMQQAIAESLGKLSSSGERCGIFPSVLKGPQDQHSVLQLLRDGPQNHILWFLEGGSNVSVNKHKMSAPFNLIGDRDLNDLLKIFSESCFLSFEERLKDPKTAQPLIRWQLDTSAASLVRAIVKVQAFIEYSGERLGVNAFDQPGVERGKQIAKQLLSKSADS